MRKNKFMRAASGLLVAVLLTTCVISGTFAKYTTSAEGSDSARVAVWGLDGTSSIKLNNLFSNEYTDDANGKTVSSTEKVIAPGTSGSAQFGFKYNNDSKTTAPEVKYTFAISTDESDCATDIKNNKNIVWSLDNEKCTNWDELLDKIEKLSGATDNTGKATYEAGKLPEAFKAKGDNLHTVSWEWKFDENNNDTTDTTMGNKAQANLDSVTLKISITAEQVD